MNKQTFFGAISAGILIGIGVIININLTIPIIGALLFSFGLLTIMQLKLPLYTGKIGFAFYGQKNLPIILLGNLIGIIWAISCYYGGNPAIAQQLTTAAVIKFSKTPLQMFFGGVICGMLIHFAVKAKATVMTIMAVMIFILIGSEHCVADFAYFLFTPVGISNIIKFLLVILGNSIGAISLEWILRLAENE